MKLYAKIYEVFDRETDSYYKDVEGIYTYEAMMNYIKPYHIASLNYIKEQIKTAVKDVNILLKRNKEIKIALAVNEGEIREQLLEQYRFNKHALNHRARSIRDFKRLRKNHEERIRWYVWKTYHICFSEYELREC